MVVDHSFYLLHVGVWSSKINQAQKLISISLVFNIFTSVLMTFGELEYFK